MSDFQGALKELILPAGAKPAAWMPHNIGRPGGQMARLKKVRPRHRMIVQMHLAGWKDTEIAKELGYTPTRVAMILKSDNPELKRVREETGELVARHMGDLVLRFRAESAKSLDTLVEIRDKVDAPSSERRLSALAILDRAGYAPVRKQINLDTNVPLQELKGVIGQIESANEVAFRRAEWTIADVNTP